MPRRRKPQAKKGLSVGWKVGLIVAVFLFLAGSSFYFYETAARQTAENSRYQAVALRSLQKLCQNYDCPEPYVAGARQRIFISDRAEYEQQSRNDGTSSDQNGGQSLAFTTKSGPRRVYVNIEEVKVLASEGIPLDDALEEILDHEVVHQAAGFQILSAPLSIGFDNKLFVAVSTSGLSLRDAEGRLGNNRSNEAYTQWLALSQFRTHKVQYNVSLYDVGPKIVEALNARVGLDRKTVFNLYVNKGLPGFTGYFTKAAGQTLIQDYDFQSGLAILFYLDRVLEELNQNQYSVSEALRRLDMFISTGYAPPQK